MKNVSNKSITYTEEFKVCFHNKHSIGYGPTKIFNDAGFDIDVIGAKKYIVLQVEIDLILKDQTVSKILEKVIQEDLQQRI